MFPIKDTIPSRKRPIITKFLIFVNVVIFIYEKLLPDEALTQLIFTYGFVPAKLSGGFSPILTSIFLHGSWMHLIGNMWSLWLFGDNVEDCMGHFKFIIFYLLCGILSGYTHYLFNPFSNVPTIGASGAIAGVMGAYFILYPHSRIITFIPIFIIVPLFVRIPAVIFLFIWFANQLYYGTVYSLAHNVAGGIAWWGHIGGFLAGMFLQKIFKKRNYVPIYGEEYWPYRSK